MMLIDVLSKKTLGVQAGVIVGFSVGVSDAFAAGGGDVNDFSSIAHNITDSIADLPGLISGLSYLIGLLLGVIGILKIKDHVENPTQTPLKDGSIRLASGGALFALPIVFEAMTTTIGVTSAEISPASLNRVELGIEN